MWILIQFLNNWIQCTWIEEDSKANSIYREYSQFWIKQKQLETAESNETVIFEINDLSTECNGYTYIVHTQMFA